MHRLSDSLFDQLEASIGLQTVTPKPKPATPKS